MNQRARRHSPEDMREMAAEMREMGLDALAERLEDGADELEAEQ